MPVRGAILLNDAMDKVVLVKGWKKGASWSFPRGKINKDERDLDCAIREVYEETGYDVKTAGLAPDENTVKAIDVTMREQHLRMFVFRGVPMDTRFEPKTRKEISVSSTGQNKPWARLTKLRKLNGTTWQTCPRLRKTDRARAMTLSTPTSSIWLRRSLFR